MQRTSISTSFIGTKSSNESDMSNKKYSKGLIPDVGKHCEQLINDFFNFCEGNLEEVKVITELRDISEPMPPKLEQIGKMLNRCKKVWYDYCDFVRAPRMTRDLFINRVKKQWLALEKSQKSQIPTKSRSRGKESL